MVINHVSVRPGMILHVQGGPLVVIKPLMNGLINGLLGYWGYSTPTYRSYGPLLITGFWAHLVDTLLPQAIKMHQNSISNSWRWRVQNYEVHGNFGRTKWRERTEKKQLQDRLGGGSLCFCCFFVFCLVVRMTGWGWIGNRSTRKYMTFTVKKTEIRVELIQGSLNYTLGG